MIKDWFTYFLYSALWRVVRTMPEKSAYSLFDSLAKFAYKRDGKRVQRLRLNYAKVCPKATKTELEELVLLGLKSGMRYWCDTFRISDWDREKILKRVKCINEDFLLEPVASGRGVIVAVPHAGNWDHAGAYFSVRGLRVISVAEHLRPDRLFRRFLKHRESIGLRILDLDAGVMGELRSFLNQGELVALVADRDLSRSGIDVKFFGSRARMPAGPAILALETGADLVTVFVGYTNEGITIDCAPPINVDKSAERKAEIARVTQVMANRFEDAIKANPTSWHMQQRIFIDNDFVERA
ncbi:MAG: phosphatidylinositol mannoside acyltransferase [Actinobacteria bacterium]|nr:phosphatidylinositol mannoside acyltransferase [Actinomycetota bacterium]NDD07010.1 phosphatidylinositol mannoside acyltransferase [Actinomycetota bacterium]